LNFVNTVALEGQAFLEGWGKEYGEVLDGSEESISMDRPHEGPPWITATTQ